MSVSKFRGYAILLAASLTMSAVIAPMAVADIGPQPPEPHPSQPNNVSKALGKIFTKHAVKSTKEEEQADPDKATDEKATTGTKLKVSDPNADAASAQQPKQEETGRPPMLTQPELTNAKIEPAQVDAENPPVMTHPKLDDPTNPLGLTDAENRLQKLIAMVNAKRYTEAKPGLVQLRQWLVDITEAHIGLYKTLNQIPSARGQAELEKELALQFAQLRDYAMMQTAKIAISEKDYPRAVKDLTEVVKSQPRSKIGLASYEMLQEIGFTEKLQLAQ